MTQTVISIIDVPVFVLQIVLPIVEL